MKKLIFPIAASVLCAYIIFFPPFHGIADNGDFARVLYACGLKITDAHTYFDTVDTAYKNGFSYIGHMVTYPFALAGLYPAPPHIYPSLAARPASLVMGYFDMRIYAAFACAWYIAAWTCLLGRICDFGKYLAACAAVLFVFFDGSYLQLFASFYGEGMILTGMVMTVLAYIRLCENPGVGKLLLFAFSSVVLVNSKIQCAVWAAAAAAVLYYIGRNFSDKGRRLVAYVCAAVVVWNGAGGYFINGAPMKAGAAYNSLSCGILAESPDSAADLSELGLPEECAADAGKGAYLDKESYAVPPEDTDISMGKIALFYLKHPARFARGLLYTAGQLSDTNIHMGTVDGAEKEDYRFNIWGQLRKNLLRNPWIAGLLAASIAAVCIRKRKKASARIMLMLLGFAAVEFMLPYIGNGACDTAKQLFPVNAALDMGILFLAGELFSLIRRDKRIDKLVKRAV